MDYAKKLIKGSGATKRYGAFYQLPTQPFEPVTFRRVATSSTRMTAPPTLMTRCSQALKTRLQMQDTDKSVAPLGDVTAGKLQPYSEFLTGKAAMLTRRLVDPALRHERQR